jgi:hypothetical protein
VTSRRIFLATLAVGVIVSTLAAEAQQTGKVYRIGVLGPTPVAPSSDEAFRQGLAN